MFGGFVASLVGAYGLFASFALRFIFPERLERPLRRIFLGFANQLDTGQSRVVSMPSGDQLLLSNTGQVRADSGSTFVAFSNRCPHLGCKVHWNAKESEFVCPCHQGIFDSDGIATAGPPAQADQQLTAYPIEQDGDSIYALVEDA